jgi:hypothetical protein
VLSGECEPVSVTSSPTFNSGSEKAAPLGESGGAGGLIAGVAGEGSLLIEVVADRAVDGREHLQTSHRGPFSSPERQVRVLCAVVGPAPRFSIVSASKISQGRPAGAGISDEHLRSTVSLQRFPKEFQRGIAITDLAHEAFQHLAFVINGAGNGSRTTSPCTRAAAVSSKEPYLPRPFRVRLPQRQRFRRRLHGGETT